MNVFRNVNMYWLFTRKYSWLQYVDSIAENFSISWVRNSGNTTALLSKVSRLFPKKEWRKISKVILERSSAMKNSDKGQKKKSNIKK